jgi:hypothetical protein
MHQGQGIINLNQKVSKTIFIKKYSKKILDLIKKNIKIYCERKAIGKLINIDFVKKKDGSVIFLPLILRDKVILKGKKKFLSVFQYVDNTKIINEYYYKLLTKIIKQTYKNISVFGTIDAIINKDQFQILEWSPHFHNIKIFKFLYDVDIIDIYFDKNDKNLVGYIFIHDENKETLKLRRYVEKNSKKVLIDYIDTEKRKDFLKKHAFIKKNFHIIYFKSNSIKDLLKISKYLENNKIRLYN